MFEREGARVVEERPARQRPLTEPEVRALIAQVTEVVVARGRSAERRRAEDVVPRDLRGPTGNFRAPMVRRGRTLLVGFHAASLEGLLAP